MIIKPQPSKNDSSNNNADRLDPWHTNHSTQQEKIPVENLNTKSVLAKPKPKFNLWLIALLATGLIAIPSTIYILSQEKKIPTNLIESLTVKVQAEDLTVKINASGTVQPIQRVNLSPKNAGRIAQLYVEQGDRVKAGQIIAKMESNDIQAQLQQALARVASAQARLNKLRNGSRTEEIVTAEARVAQSQARLNQLKAGSRSEEIAGTQARLAQAEARLAELKAGSRVEEIARAKANLEQAKIRLADAQKGSPDEIAQAKARLQAAEAAANLAAQKVKRNQALQAEGAIAIFTFEEYQKELKVAQANVAEAKRRLEQIQINQQKEIDRLFAAVEVEQQTLRQLENGTRREEIMRSEAEVAEARSKLAEVLNGTRPEEIARAEAEVAEAQSQLTQVMNGPRIEEIAQGEAELAEALAQARFQEVQLEDTNVRAPFDGIITQRYALQGAFVTPATSASSADSASSTSIVTLAKDVEVLAKIPEADISQISKGQTVEIIADAYPDQVFTGAVRLIAPEAVKERDVTLFQVRVKIEDGKQELRSGMNVDLQFLGKQLDNALVIPTVAIVTNKGKTGVLIPNEKNKPIFQPVTVGSTIGNKITVLDGLKTGDRVFIELPEGTKLDQILRKMQ